MKIADEAEYLNYEDTKFSKSRNVGLVEIYMIGLRSL